MATWKWRRRFCDPRFHWSDSEGNITTLGRGGSDYSAALLAEAINANELQIWTDVIGIYSTDPRITEHARPIPEISFDEAAEMATFGAKILHPATLIPAMRKDIKVFVGRQAPSDGGTWIYQSVEITPYRAIAVKTRYSSLSKVQACCMQQAFCRYSPCWQIKI